MADGAVPEALPEAKKTSRGQGFPCLRLCITNGTFLTWLQLSPLQLPKAKRWPSIFAAYSTPPEMEDAALAAYELHGLPDVSGLASRRGG